MDTTELERAYRQLFDVCARGQSHGFRAPADTAEWSAEQVLAHIAANDRLLLATTAAVLGGTVPQGRPAYDDSAATVGPALDVLARAAGGLPDLVATVRQTGRELVLLARRLEGAVAIGSIHVRIVEGGSNSGLPRVDGPVPLSGLLATHAQVHLPDHTAQLAALSKP